MIDQFKQYAAKLGYQKPTLIQTKAYEMISNHRSMVGLSPTGSGKTVAFTVPFLEQLAVNDDLQLLVVEPSAELAMQTTNVMRSWAQLVDLKVQPIIGGANIKRQTEKLKDKPNVIVGTTGRIINLIELGKIKLDHLTGIVIDEADNLLSEETLPQLRDLVNQAPKSTTLTFFSATDSEIVQNVNQWFTQSIEVIDVRKLDDTKGPVSHNLLSVSNQKKNLMLKRLLHMKKFKALVFFNKMSDLEKTAGFLKHENIKVAAKLTSDQRQTSRQKALKDFRLGNLRLLLTTDVAARGIDIEKLPAVINYDLPADDKVYTHRTGRTGRMYQSGMVINLGNDHDFRILKRTLNSEYELKNIYFDGNELTYQKPKVVKYEATTKKETQVKKGSGKPGNPKAKAKVGGRNSQPTPPNPTKKRNKNKHSKRKGMRKPKKQ